MRRFRVFISSPGDTLVERRRAESVVSRLNGEFAGIARLEAIRWETEHYSAHKTYQDQIPPAMDCDVVIGILRWRLGTELPPGFETQPSGEPYPSGTAYEILTAMEKRRSGAELPDVFVFRFTGGAPSIVLGESEEAAKRRDWAMLQSFLASWFVTEQGHFIAALNNYASEDDFERQVEALLRKWLAGKVQGRQGVPWPAAKGSPFRGLDAFGTQHAAVFFGRSADIRRATDLWRGASVGRWPFLLVVGASGAGKSSLVRAGLIPRLTTPGVVPEVDLWRVAVVRPGDSPNEPFVALAAALLRGEADLPSVEQGRGSALPEIAEGDSRTPADLGAVLAHADTGAARVIVNALTRIAERQRDSERHERATRCDLLLLVDQAEELFASSVASDTRSRFANLLKVLVASGRVWLAVTLRADTYAAWLTVPALRALKDGGVSYDLASPGTAELAEIVRAPAAAAGLSFDLDAATGERLDEVLLSEADQPDMLPLVQLALSRLWEARETRGGETVLSFSAYRRLGGVKGIIEEAGERAVMGLDVSRLAPLIRKLGELSSLQGPGSHTVTIRSVRLEEAAPDLISSALVNALVKARLLTLSNESGVAIRLAHQRVLTDWMRAASIVIESRRFYQIRDMVEVQYHRWNANGCSVDFLIQGGLPLAEANFLVRDYNPEIDNELSIYILISNKRARRNQNILRVATLSFGIIAVISLVFGRLAFVESKKSDMNFNVASQDIVEMIDGILEDTASNTMSTKTSARILKNLDKGISILSAEAPLNKDIRRAKANVSLAYSKYHERRSYYDEAAKFAAMAIDEFSSVLTSDPHDEQSLIGIGLSNMSLAENSNYDPDARLSALLKSADTYRKVLSENPSSGKALVGLLDDLVFIIEYRERLSGKITEKEVISEIAQTIDLIRSHDTDENGIRSIADAYRVLGKVEQKRGDSVHALMAMNAASKTIKDSSIRSPILYSEEIIINQDLSLLYEETGEKEKALELLQSNLDFISIDFARSSLDLDDLERLWGTYEKIAEIRLDLGQKEEALAVMHRNSILVRKYLSKNEESNVLKSLLVRSIYSTARMQIRLKMESGMIISELDESLSLSRYILANKGLSDFNDFVIDQDFENRIEEDKKCYIDKEEFCNNK